MTSKFSACYDAHIDSQLSDRLKIKNMTKLELINSLKNNFPNDEPNGIDSFILDILADIEAGKSVLSAGDVLRFGGADNLKKLATEILDSIN